MVIYLICSLFNYVFFKIMFGSTTLDFILGTLCDIKNSCYDNPCDNGGTCSVTDVGDAQCHCDGEWTGSRCTLKIGKDCQPITGTAMSQELSRQFKIKEIPHFDYFFNYFVLYLNFINS